MKITVPQTFSSDLPVLKVDEVLADTGSIALFDALLTESWPSQGAPSGSAQTWTNLGTGSNLVAGSSDSNTTNDPGWGTDGGFTFSSNQTFSPVTDTFLAQNFIQTVWIKAAATTGSSKGISGYFGGGVGRYYLFLNSSNELLSYVYDSSDTLFALNSGSVLTPGEIYQVGMSFEPSGSDGIVRTFVNGAQVNSGTASFNALNTTNGTYALGNNGTGGNDLNGETIYRMYMEDLATSGRTAAEVALLDYEANSSVFS